MYPYSHKLAAFRCYINRLLNTPLCQTVFLSDLNITKQIAVNNGYKADLIDQMLNSMPLRKALDSVHTTKGRKTSQKFFSLTYFGTPSEKIGKHRKFRFNNVNISFST